MIDISSINMQIASIFSIVIEDWDENIKYLDR